MATIILGQTLVFWSGALMGTAFLLDMMTCYWVNSLPIPFLKNIKPPLSARYHHMFKPLSISLFVLHATIAILMYWFGIIL